VNAVVAIRGEETMFNWCGETVLCVQGRQEDAEEYLGFTLNGLHEEMLALKRLISPHEDGTCSSE
jgi:hypothetical protein